MTATTSHGREAVSRAVVGRERELRLVLAAVTAGRDVLLEGTFSPRIDPETSTMSTADRRDAVRATAWRWWPSGPTPPSSSR